MREFAPKNSHPSDAELAAYIDGALGKAEAERVEAHLADCEECYFVYSETLQFQLEEGGEVLPFRQPQPEIAQPEVDRPPRLQPRVAWWAAAAAVLVVGAGSWYAYQTAFLGLRPELVIADIAPDPQERPLQDILWKYKVYRGGVNAEPELARQSFQVGALLVDFHLSARTGATEPASIVWRQIGSVVDETDYMEELSKRIFAEADRMDPGQNPADASKSLQAVAVQLPRTEVELRDDSTFFSEYIDLGKWTEAGRVAAKTEDSKFFEDHKNRRFLSYALKEWKPEKSEEVRLQLKKIEQIWDQGELGSRDFKALAGHFQAILDEYDFVA